MVAQRIEGEGKAPVHRHEARLHAHDHYHVSHHHRALPLAKWSTGRTGTATNTTTELLNSHDYDLNSEEDGHAKEAYVHDHAVPHHPPA